MFVEPSAVGGGVGVDGEAELVDGDVMVIPAKTYQVVGMVAVAVGPLADVLGLEPVTAGTSLNRTLPLVPPQDEASHRRGDRLSLPGSCPHSLNTDSSRLGWITK